MTRQGIFVTGTDTGIGKTLTSAFLASALARVGLKPGYFKPIQTGEDSDTATVEKLAAHSKVEIHPPIYLFPEPTAPSRAAENSGETISVARIVETWQQTAARPWVIEGAGGLLVPLNRKETIRDLIESLGVPVLLVASTRLGTINHTLLALEGLERQRIPVAGIVLNGDDDPGLSETLANFTRVPVISNLPRLFQVTPALIHELALNIFPTAVLRALFPAGDPLHE